MKFKLSLLFLFGLVALTVAAPHESTAKDTLLEELKEALGTNDERKSHFAEGGGGGDMEGTQGDEDTNDEKKANDVEGDGGGDMEGTQGDEDDKNSNLAENADDLQKRTIYWLRCVECRVTYKAWKNNGTCSQSVRVRCSGCGDYSLITDHCKHPWLARCNGSYDSASKKYTCNSWRLYWNPK